MVTLVLVLFAVGCGGEVAPGPNVDATVAAAVAATRTASDVQKKVAPPAPATPTRESPSDMHLAISKKYFDSGTGYLLNGEYEIAIQEFGKAIEIYPAYVQAYGTRGFTYSYMGQYQRAIEDYDKAIELGATCEGQPGFRPQDATSGFYAGYFRDLDGNKLNAFCMVE